MMGSQWFIRLCLALVIVSSFLAANVSDVSAAGIKIAPLEYKTSLKNNERKQGYIDVSNPSDYAVTVVSSVRGFTQTDSSGTLQFYEDEQLEAGIRTELTGFTLQPRESLRLFFEVDAAKLPKGNVFAAIFFTSELQRKVSGVAQEVRLGTLLSLTNGTPVAEKATITELSIPFVQIGTKATGSYVVRNDTSKSEATGFYPAVTVSVSQGYTQKQRSSLVFSGIARSNDFETDTIGPGIHKITVSYDDSGKSSWVIVMPGWLLIVALITLIVVLVELLLWIRRQKRRRNTAAH